MSSNKLLTSDDLDEIGHEALAAEDPGAIVADLVTAVDSAGLADPADSGYALLLAAEITERGGDLEPALALAERAVEAYRAQGDGADGYARARRAELLARLGRDDEATAAFNALRPLLVRDRNAASYLTEALEECGRASIAEQWLTSALDIVLDRAEGGPDRNHVKLVYSLLQARRRVRSDLGMLPDGHDDLADRMRAAAANGGARPPAVAKRAGQGVMFWPKAEFDQVLLRWPAFVDVYGHTWDEHRTDVEKALRVWAESGGTGFTLYPGSAEGLADHLARHGGDPGDAELRARYAEQLEKLVPGVAWPPGRNDACWCGAAGKYKKCCLLRSRH